MALPASSVADGARPSSIDFGNVFAGQAIDIREIAGQVWLVSFIGPDLGLADMNQDPVDPLAILSFRRNRPRSLRNKL